MSIFAIADLHLPGQDQKPMDVFGSHWERHFDLISEHWRAQISNEDIVLIAGDISWAMQLTEAEADLRAIGALPGQKVLLRGNHDYWWSTISRVRAMLGEGMYAVQNDAVVLGGQVICGTRGWTFPTAGHPLEEQENKIYRRELMRLEFSLQEAARCEPGTAPIVMMHFPPLPADGEETEFTFLLERFGASDVVYGHLHGAGVKNGFTGEKNGIRYHLTSCDALGFIPKKIQ